MFMENSIKNIGAIDGEIKKSLENINFVSGGAYRAVFNNTFQASEPAGL
jgi:hypothetical protein